MYGWIWRHLPGGLPAKLLGATVLLLVAVAVLFLVVFPRVEPLLPFSDVTVEGLRTAVEEAPARPALALP